MLRRINQAWLSNRPRELQQLFHKNIVMVLPGFSGRVEGKDALIASFEEFCENGVVHQFSEKESQVEVVGATAVASFLFEVC